MTTRQLLLSQWHWHPSVLIGAAVLLISQVVVEQFQLTRRTLWFAGGVLMLLVALLSPLHVLGDGYLFSVHMLQHLLLLLIVPPLLLLGTPKAPARLLRGSLPGRLLARAWLPWLLGIGAMWLWHLPALYNAALADEGLHILEHLCFLATATIFWWPILAPSAQDRLDPPVAVFYLFTAMLASSVLGIILTFASPGLYPIYLHPHGSPEIVRLIRLDWGLSAEMDQQFGGLLMWVPGSLIYLVAILGTLAVWYSSPDVDEADEMELAISRHDERAAGMAAPRQRENFHVG